MKNLISAIFSPERIFLADGFGAALTATMLGVVLPAFVGFFGMPTTALYPLTAAAASYAIYSLSVWGIAYFVSEKLIILALVLQEFSLYRKS